jgi:hypothetical protein
LLAALSFIFLMRTYFGARSGNMEAPILLVGAFSIYFYAGYFAAALFSASPQKRLLAAIGFPAAVLAVLSVADLIAGPSTGGWINLKIQYKHFWAIPGMPIYSLLSRLGGAAQRRVPLAEMRARNIDVDIMAAVARPDGGLDSRELG